MPEYLQGNTEDSYDEYIQKGIQALQKRDTKQAVEWFKEARKEARRNKNKEQKDEARELIRKTEGHYKPYFEFTIRGERHAVQRDYKKALVEYDNALKEAQRIARIRIPVIEKLDAQFLSEAETRKSEAEKQRIEAYQRAVSFGISSMGAGSPNEALSQLEYAAGQMEYYEASSARVDGLIKEAQYNIWLQKGDRQFSWGNYELALEYFGKARSFDNHYDLNSRIARANRRLYEQQLALADTLFRQEAYALSAKAFRRAEQYDDRGEVYRMMMSRHDELLAKGEQDFRNGAYYSARVHFRNALHFQESTDVTAYLKEVERIIQYMELMENARGLMEEDKIDEAYKVFEKAAAIQPGEAAEQQLQRIEGYREHIRQGNAAMREDDPEGAVVQFKKAKVLIYTPEVNELISKAACMYSDLTVEVDTDELMGKDLSQASIYLEKVSGKHPFHKEEEFRGGQVHFFGLEPGRYRIYLRGLREKNSGFGFGPPPGKEYGNGFQLNGGKYLLRLSAKGIDLKEEDSRP